MVGMAARQAGEGGPGTRGRKTSHESRLLIWLRSQGHLRLPERGFRRRVHKPGAPQTVGLAAERPPRGGGQVTTQLQRPEASSGRICGRLGLETLDVNFRTLKQKSAREPTPTFKFQTIPIDSALVTVCNTCTNRETR